MRVTIIRTGVANIASVVATLSQLGATTELTADPNAVEESSHVLLPGVGSFGSGMAALHEARLIEPLRVRFKNGRPTLAICLGMQLLARSSAESPGVEGLGIVDTEVIRLPDTVRVPHFGWNEVLTEDRSPDEQPNLLKPGFAYFAHSFHLGAIPKPWHTAYSVHGIKFPAAIENGALLACQFHPELSGEWGKGLLRRWLGDQKG